ncbi:PREDICTED: neurotrypsin-like [Branchiostoma belcheri]|uniref:Neurotrypsin-like n=1 Tax=Branchiostoma belcheri TaxID=7741 RepID=A0A6P5AYJ5_BRABE|nr:PREDICTED: neurotrypsin-like [Branchiostoma belcheri]
MRNLGRLEVYHDTQWWPVCADGWGLEDAEIACQTLGYPGAVSSFPGTSIFGKSGGVVARVSCARSDGASDNCTRSVVTDGVTCGNNSVVGIYCHASLRLVNGSSYNEGRVEIYRSGRWGTVCDSPDRPPGERWGQREAEVVCRQLTSGVARIYPPGWFGDGENGSSAIWLGEVHCSGSEDELQECGYTRWGVPLEDAEFCREKFAVAVACGGPPGPFFTREVIHAGNIRLVDWPLYDFRKLEVYNKNNATWRAVCEHNWDDDMTQVACEILDYPGARNYTTSGYLFGQGQSVVLNASVSCNTSSHVIDVTTDDCTWTMFTDGDLCHYEERVGIQCQG